MPEVAHIHPQTVIHMNYGLIVVSFLFVCLRLYVRTIVIRKFSLADVFVIIAWSCYFGNIFVDWFTHKCGMWDPRLRFHSDGKLPDFNGVVKDHTALRNGLIVMYAVQPLYVIELYSVKMAFLLLYRELFPTSMVKLRRALYFTFVLVILGAVTITLLNIFYCFPISQNWTLDPEQRCLAWAAIKPYYYSASMNIATDLLVYALPFFLLPTLRYASKRKLVGLVFIFSLGLFCIICTISRILMLDTSADTATVGMWYSMEQFFSIVVVCCPPLKSFWSYERKKHSRSGSGNSSRDRASGTKNIDVVAFWRKVLESSTIGGTRFGRTSVIKSASRAGDVEAGTFKTEKTYEDATIGEWTVDATIDVGTSRMVGNGPGFAGGLAPRQKKGESVQVVEIPAPISADTGTGQDSDAISPVRTVESQYIPNIADRDQAVTEDSENSRKGFWRKLSLKLDTSATPQHLLTFGGSTSASTLRTNRSPRTPTITGNTPTQASASHKKAQVQNRAELSPNFSSQPGRTSSTSVLASPVVEEMSHSALSYNATRRNEMEGMPRGSFGEPRPTRFSTANLSAFGGNDDEVQSTTDKDRQRRSRYTTSSHGADSVGDDVRGGVSR